MSAEKHKPEGNGAARPRRRVFRWAVSLGLLLALVGAIAYLRGTHFQNWLRDQLITQVERATGGEVELERFTWNLKRLEFVAENVTIHGKEEATQVPLAHADRLTVRLKILSVLSRQVGLRYVLLERPVAHVMVYPDGSTNLPEPKVKREARGKSPVDVLFDLAVEKLELRRGELLLNQQRIPLDLEANDVSAEMTYALGQRRYDGHFQVGHFETRFKDFRRFASTAEARFALYPDAAELKALRWESGRSNLEASGTLRNFAEPKIELTYNASLDLGEAGAVARVRGLRSGSLVLNGSGRYSLAELATAGKLTLHDGAWNDGALRVRELDLGANYSATADRISLSSISGQVFGGRVTGDAEVRNWMVAERPVAAPGEVGSARGPQRGSASLKLSGISVERVAEAISSARLPLARTHPAGSTNGTVHATWTGTPANAEVAVALDVEPPPAPAGGQTPLNARIRGVYRGRTQVLELTELGITTRGARLTASGALGSRDANLRLEVEATSLSEFQTLIAAYRGPAALPIELNGRLAFRGTARGRLDMPTVAGRLELQDFTTLISPAAMKAQLEGQNLRPATPQQAAGLGTPSQPPHRVHWDALTADVLYSPELLQVRNASLLQRNARITLDGTIGLHRGRSADDSPIQARAVVRNADIADLQSLVGSDFPVSGTVNFELSASGTLANPRAQGRVQITNAIAYGDHIESASANVHLAGREVRFDNVTAIVEAGRVTGALAYNLSTRRFALDLRGDSFDLARYARMQTPRVKVGGVMEFTASGSGTLEEPVIHSNILVRGLMLNGEPFGELTAKAVTTDEVLALSGGIRLQNASMAVDGTVRLRGNFPANIHVVVSQFDVDPFLKPYLRGLTGHSAVAGNIRIEGPLRQPRALTVNAVIDEFVAEVEKVRLQNSGPIRLRVADQVVHIEQFHAVGDDTDITARGTAQIAGPQRLDIRADGRVNLALLQSFDPDLRSSGSATADVTLGGTLQHPRILGRLEIRNGSLALVDLPNALSEINGTMVFNQDRLQVEKLAARTGGGTVNMGGFVTYSRGLGFNLTANGADIRLRYGGASMIADLGLRLTGSLRNSLLTGDVTVKRFAMAQQFDLGTALARSKQAQGVQEPDSPLNNMRLDIHVVSAPELQVQTSLAKVTGTADLRVRGTASRPGLLGRISIAQGDVFFNGTEYRLERGEISFVNPTKIEPVLDIEAFTRVQQYDITLGFHGTPDKLTTTYRAEPPLPTGDIVALLAFGRTREQTLQTQEQGIFSDPASEAILGQAANTLLSRRAQRLFGISRLKIDPEVGGSGNPNARVTVQQQVSDVVVLTFSTNVAESAQQEIQIEYNVNRNVAMILGRDKNGVIAFEILLRQRLR